MAWQERAEPFLLLAAASSISFRKEELGKDRKGCQAVRCGSWGGAEGLYQGLSGCRLCLKSKVLVIRGQKGHTKNRSVSRVRGRVFPADLVYVLPSLEGR